MKKKLFQCKHCHKTTELPDGPGDVVQCDNCKRYELTYQAVEAGRITDTPKE